MKVLFMLLIGLMFARGSFAGDVNITLDGDNFFAVTSTFNELLLEEFSRKVMTYEGDDMYVYFDSPGGSVFAMTRIMGIMKSSDVNFICVARFAASAAFAMFQTCDERYMLYDGILMQHNASIGIRDELPRIRTLLNVIERIIDDVEKDISERLKISFEKYKRLINSNLWLSANEAIDKNAADAVINSITCSKRLIESEVLRPVLNCSFFGCSINHSKFSGCPLLTLPIVEDNDRPSRTIKTNFLNDFMWIMPDVIE